MNSSQRRERERISRPGDSTSATACNDRSMRTERPSTRKLTARRRLLIVVPLIALCAIVNGCAILGNAYSRQQIDVEAFADARWQSWEPLSGLEVASSTLCEGVEGCVQAVESEHLTILKFDSVSSATAYVDAGDTSLHQIDPLVLDFDDTDLSEADQDEVISTLSNINADSPD
jgi:hypothetical protein